MWVLGKQASSRKARWAVGMLLGVVALEAILGMGKYEPSKSQAGMPQAAWGRGRVIEHAQVELIFWGPAYSRSGPSSAEVRLATNALLTSRYLEGLRQYGIGSARLVGSVEIRDSAAGAKFSTKQVGDFVRMAIANGRVRPPGGNNNLVYLVVIDRGSRSGANLGGEHAYLDARGGLRANWPNKVAFAWVQDDGFLSQLMIRLSHELVETVSDPEMDGWQVNSQGMARQEGPPWQEISDICAETDRLTVWPEESVGGVGVASYWSQVDQKCIIPTDKGVLTFSLVTRASAIGRDREEESSEWVGPAALAA